MTSIGNCNGYLGSPRFLESNLIVTNNQIEKYTTSCIVSVLLEHYEYDIGAVPASIRSYFERFLSYTRRIAIPATLTQEKRSALVTFFPRATLEFEDSWLEAVPLKSRAITNQQEIDMYLPTMCATLASDLSILFSPLMQGIFVGAILRTLDGQGVQLPLAHLTAPPHFIQVLPPHSPYAIPVHGFHGMNASALLHPVALLNSHLSLLAEAVRVIPTSAQSEQKRERVRESSCVSLVKVEKADTKTATAVVTEAFSSSSSSSCSSSSSSSMQCVWLPQPEQKRERPAVIDIVTQAFSQLSLSSSNSSSSSSSVKHPTKHSSRENRKARRVKIRLARDVQKLSSIPELPAVSTMCKSTQDTIRFAPIWEVSKVQPRGEHTLGSIFARTPAVRVLWEHGHILARILTFLFTANTSLYFHQNTLRINRDIRSLFATHWVFAYHTRGLTQMCIEKVMPQAVAQSSAAPITGLFYRVLFSTITSLDLRIMVQKQGSNPISTLQKYIRSYPNLHTLHLPSRCILTDELGQTLAAAQNLRHLDISTCHKMNLAALQHLPQVTHLYSYFPYETNEIFWLSQQQKMAQERYLEQEVMPDPAVLEPRSLIEYGDAQVETIVQAMPQLRHLCLGSVPTVTNNALRHVGRLQHLRGFSIDSAHIRSQAISYLQPLRALTSLRLTNCPWLGDGDFVSIAEQFRALTTLMCGHNVIGRDGIRALATLPALTTLSLGIQIHLYPADILLIAGCRALRRLSFHWMEGIPASTFIHLITNLPHLEVFYVRALPPSVAVSLQGTLSSRPRLRFES